MVMAQPSTQYVAHEFVRQYYTMLHKDPTQLHRFYTRESHLTHGVSPNAKAEEPVTGQEAIFEKISQLNFRNCHAKIRSVDSHPTIGGGVVIQVTGELSNSGMAMRKFMQTFVLAQQDVKRYNVFNDIFRYQDETFEDTEVDETADDTVGSEVENGFANHDSAADDSADPIIPDSVEELPEEEDPAETPIASIDEECDHLIHAEATQPEEEDGINEKDSDSAYGVDLVTDPEPAEETLVNGDENIDQQDDLVEVNGIESPETLIEQEIIEDDGTEFKEYDGNDIKVEEPVEEVEAPRPEPEVEEPKVFSWAALTKKNTPGIQTPGNQTLAPIISKPPKKISPTQQPPKSVPKKREEPAVKSETPEESRRRTGPAPDNHQIFIGNLPVGVTEKDIREAFDEFGTIVEVRLNPKNFGFIAFTGPEAPVKILNKNKNIIIHSNTINTEVKRSVGGGRGGGGGFRRRDRDSGRGRSNDMNKNSNRNTNGSSGGGSGGGTGYGGGQNKPGKNSSYPQKQPRSG